MSLGKKLSCSILYNEECLIPNRMPPSPSPPKKNEGKSIGKVGDMTEGDGEEEEEEVEGILSAMMMMMMRQDDRDGKRGGRGGWKKFSSPSYPFFLLRSFLSSPPLFPDASCPSLRPPTFSDNDVFFYSFLLLLPAAAAEARVRNAFVHMSRDLASNSTTDFATSIVEKLNDMNEV